MTDIRFGVALKDRNSIIVTFVVLLVISFVVIGCGGKTPTQTSSAQATQTTLNTTTVATTTAKPTTPTTVITSTTTTTKTTTVNTTTTTSAITTIQDPFKRLDKALYDLNIYFEKTWMYAEAIGAKEGYKYATRSGTFELYLYDTESADYKEAVKNNAMSVAGTLFPAIIKDGFALYFYDNAKEELRNQVKGILFA